VKKVLTLADAGRLGGKARAKALTAEQRQEIARNAINARWDRVRANGTAAALETETELTESTSQTKKRNA
jgi:hypothetical protein